MAERGGLYIRCLPIPSQGYGQVAIEIARYFISQGCPVKIRSVTDGSVRPEIPPDVARQITRKDNRWPFEFVIAPPYDTSETPCRRIHFTMWETGRLHHTWVERFNKAAAIIVPSEFCRLIFSACGVNKDIFHVPLGVDHQVYTYAPVATDGPTVFGTMGRLTHGGIRKRFELVIEAFQLAFPIEQDVRLEIKCTRRCQFPVPADPRIVVKRKAMSQEEVVAWYHGLTAYVTASCGEGFGMCVLEAMSCGRPVIATDWSGHKELIDEQAGYPVRYELVPALGMYSGLGLWAEPDLWSLKAQMLTVYRDRAGAIGRGFAATVRSNAFSWERTGELLIQILGRQGVFDEFTEQPAPAPAAPDEPTVAPHKRILRPLPATRPARENRSLYVMGPLPMACGVGQYARQVADALGCGFASYQSLEQSVVILNHHRHYYERNGVFNDIYRLYERGCTIILDVHDPGGVEDLKGFVDGVIYHSKDFAGEFEPLGCPTLLLPLMCPTLPPGGKKLVSVDAEYLIGWHGLWQLHKGTEILIEAVHELRKQGIDAGLVGFGAIHEIDDSDSRYRSEKHFDNCIRLASQLGLRDKCALRASLTSYADIRATLEPCDVLCLPYDHYGPGQSSSAATALAMGKPLVVSNVPMFADLKDVAEMLKGVNTDELVRTLKVIAESCAGWRWDDVAARCEGLRARAMSEAERRSPSNMATRYQAFVKEVTG